MSFSNFQRQRTLKIDFSTLNQRPNLGDVHEEIYNQIGVEEDDVESLELCYYKKAVFLKVKRQELVQELIARCNGELKFIVDNTRHSFPVTEVSPEVISFVVYSVPPEIPDTYLKEQLEFYGRIRRIQQCYHRSYRYRVYNGRRIIYFEHVKTSPPRYFKLGPYNLQILPNDYISPARVPESINTVNAPTQRETSFHVNFSEFPTLSEQVLRRRASLNTETRVDDSQQPAECLNSPEVSELNAKTASVDDSGSIHRTVITTNADIHNADTVELNGGSVENIGSECTTPDCVTSNDSVPLIEGNEEAEARVRDHPPNSSGEQFAQVQSFAVSAQEGPGQISETEERREEEEDTAVGPYHNTRSLARKRESEVSEFFSSPSKRPLPKNKSTVQTDTGQKL